MFRALLSSSPFGSMFHFATHSPTSFISGLSEVTVAAAAGDGVEPDLVRLADLLEAVEDADSCLVLARRLLSEVAAAARG